MRALNASQAGRCESATTPRCKCRCGGAFHGANRVPADAVDRLPADDPHRPGVGEPEQLPLIPRRRRPIFGTSPRTR